MSGHGVECVGEGELAGQVGLVAQGEELEDVGVVRVSAGVWGRPSRCGRGRLYRV
jgi:hypothetical protein